MNRISETDLILNADGSVYHLNLLPGDIADTIITVGDPERVDAVSKYFDHVEIKKTKREFTTHTGYLGNKRLTVISTGIGTGNIDIVLNELDALVNIDLSKRLPHPNPRALNIIRIGTSGAIQADIPVDTLLISSLAFGLDPLMHFYKQELSADEQILLSEFKHSLSGTYEFSPYLAKANAKLIDCLGKKLCAGITITAPGFYAPQGRQVRAKSSNTELMQILQNFRSGTLRITNLEMETAGIYGLSATLGHNAISFNIILANRATNIFSTDPVKVLDLCIREVLNRISDNLN